MSQRAAVYAQEQTRNSAGSFLSVNIGCGTSAADGWYNIDNSPTIWLSRIPLAQRLLGLPAWAKNVRRHNVLKGLPFKDGSVDFIYASHTFEHFSYPQSLALARECVRVLKPGGVLRIVVPDLEHQVREYLADPAVMASHRFIAGLLMQHSWRDWLHPGAHHSQMFDSRSLLALMREAGFDNPHKSRFGESRVPSILSVESELRKTGSLYVEAEKPAARLSKNILQQSA